MDSVVVEVVIAAVVITLVAEVDTPLLPPLPTVAALADWWVKVAEDEDANVPRVATVVSVGIDTVERTTVEDTVVEPLIRDSAVAVSLFVDDDSEAAMARANVVMLTADPDVGGSVILTADANVVDGSRLALCDAA